MTEQPVFDILGVGTATIDDFIHVRSYPAPDQKEKILRENRRFGGLVGTALAAASRLGSRCGYLGMFGSDEASLVLVRGLEEAGIDCSLGIRGREVRPIHSIIVVDESKHTRNIFYTDPVRLMPENDQVEGPVVAQAKILLIDQLGIAAARFARRFAIPVVADMDWAGRDDQQEFMGLADHLILSARFAEQLTGHRDPIETVRALHGEKGRRCTAVTYGKHGCYYLSKRNGNRVEHVQALQIREVETTGCGDVFHGAYASALASTNDIAQCLIYATAAASLYAGRPSGWEHLPTGPEVDKLVGELARRNKLARRNM
ncbi:MAG TPA: PfkB family carbohydrate kinase [Spirochaetia bacterium]|nr:PfkB family carbohydrate kinase [Spirochaetia bacterium]